MIARLILEVIYGQKVCWISSAPLAEVDYMTTEEICSGVML